MVSKLKSGEQIVAEDMEYIHTSISDLSERLIGKRILIAGGAGFLGYYLTLSLLYFNESLSDEHCLELVLYDNFSRGIPDWLKKLEGRAGLTIVQHDIRDPLPEDLGVVDYIIHAATIASPSYYRKHPIETMDANVKGLRIILDYCLGLKNEGAPVSGVLFFSTSEIYGDPTPENIPTPESYPGRVSCAGPRACYDESKRYGETLCVNFARQYDLPIRIVRPFNNYGPGLKITDKRVLPDFARDVIAGRDIVMLSKGSPSRTFCYIADAVVGYFKVFLKGRNGEAYNIGIAQPEISILQLAEKVVEASGELFGYEGKVIRNESDDEDYLVDNPNRRCPQISKAQSKLDYDPRVSVDEGIRRALCWYYDNHEAEEG